MNERLPSTEAGIACELCDRPEFGRTHAALAQSAWPQSARALLGNVESCELTAPVAAVGHGRAFAPFVPECRTY